MMINPEAMKQIALLEQEYERKWGIQIDYTAMPSGITQEKLAEILERIVRTGESVLVGWDNIRRESSDAPAHPSCSAPESV